MQVHHNKLQGLKLKAPILKLKPPKPKKKVTNL